MEPGREDRRDADEAEGDEGRAGADETVQRMGGIDRREQGRGARRRDDAGDVDPAPRRFGGQRRLSPPQDLAGRDEAEREGEAEQDARTGADQSRLDRIAHQEDAAEPEREPADPHRPACAELLLEAFLARRRGQGRRGQIRDEFGLDLGFGLRVRRAASRGRLGLEPGPGFGGARGRDRPGGGVRIGRLGTSRHARGESVDPCLERSDPGLQVEDHHEGADHHRRKADDGGKAEQDEGDVVHGPVRPCLTPDGYSPAWTTKEGPDESNVTEVEALHRNRSWQSGPLLAPVDLPDRAMEPNSASIVDDALRSTRGGLPWGAQHFFGSSVCRFRSSFFWRCSSGDRVALIGQSSREGGSQGPLFSLWRSYSRQAQPLTR